MKKKKLIRVTTADISLNSLLRGQLKYLNQYYEVVGVAKDTGVLNEVASREGIRVIDAPLERPISIGKDIKVLWFLWRLFRREKPWCVHANTPKGSLLAMVAAWAARVPNRIYTVTGLRYQATTGMLRTILKTMERVTCCCANHVIPEGEGVKRALREDRITGKQLQVVYHGNINGKDTSYLSREATSELLRAENEESRLMEDATPFDGRRYMRNKLRYTDHDFVFILIARMVRDKGINELAEVMSRLLRHSTDLPRQPKLLIVGEKEVQSGGNITPEAQLFLSDSAAVFYAGLQKDVRPYLLAADALVFPSYREGFPNVPMEAGAMELPCIVTNINGCNEIIIDGENGVIIPAPVDRHGHLIQFASDDPQADGFSSPMAKALYQAMCDFIKNADNTNRIAANSRRLIQERYEQRDVWEALRQRYAEL
jgi:hypothetical protein